MTSKKSRKADLSKFTSLFLWLGLVLVLFISWRVIESKKFEGESMSDGYGNVYADDFEQTYVVEKIKPKPVVTKKRVEIKNEIEIKPDNDKEESTSFLPTEINNKKPVIIDSIPTVDPDDDEDINVPYVLVEQPPVFPGCEKYINDKKKLMECTNKKINRLIKRKFNKDLAEDLGLTGRIRINVVFVVDKNGNVTHIQARSTKSKALEKEAVRVVKQMPRWKPGEQRGKKVKVVYTLPIVFQVD